MQRRVLRHLADGPSTNVQMVAAGVGGKSSVSTACLALEEYCEIYREVPQHGEATDRRIHWYGLADAGRERLAELEAGEANAFNGSPASINLSEE